MINWLHAQLHRPQRDWDPVPSDVANAYAAHEWRQPTDQLVDELDALLGGLAGKRVLDLGAGPGHYSVALARRRALVTWHDVSRNYLRIARQRALEAGVQIQFSLGYMEDAAKFASDPFDLVFNRIAWSYGMSDAKLAALIYRLIAAGGYAFVEVNTEGFENPKTAVRRIVYLLNRYLWIKIGHPHPPAGRVPRLFINYAADWFRVDHPLGNDRILLRKPSLRR